MRLPRRTPWASLAELDQLCSWVYSDESDWDAKLLAVHRLSAWKAITTLPHALESLLALLVARLQDNAQQPAASTSTLSLRQSYAAAVIRLVNGLVDPLQVGAYARSISSIAAQLGLPAWLVELRHAATHEDLPSLELLREAASESMTWLLHHYFLPTLNPSVDAAPPLALRPLVPALKQYKSLLKLTTRDASLITQYRADIARLVRDVERWVAEATVSASVAASEGEAEWALSGAYDDVLDEGDRKERWALERLCDALLEKGVLVPVSRKKRAPVKGSLLPPQSSLALWSTLLDHLISHHRALPSILVNRIISYLVAEPDSYDVQGTPASPRDASYDLCLASWAMWFMSRTEAKDGAPGDYSYRDDAFLLLANGLGPRIAETAKSMPAAHALFKALCASDAHFAAVSNVIINESSVPSSQWDESNIDVMDDRLRTLLSLRTASPTEDINGSTTTAHTPPMASVSEDMDIDVLPEGWRLLSAADGWRPCPIGVS